MYLVGRCFALNRCHRDETVLLIPFEPVENLSAIWQVLLPHFDHRDSLFGCQETNEISRDQLVPENGISGWSVRLMLLTLPGKTWHGYTLGLATKQRAEPDTTGHSGTG